MHPLISAYREFNLLWEIKPRLTSPYWPSWCRMVDVLHERIAALEGRA